MRSKHVFASLVPARTFAIVILAFFLAGGCATVREGPAAGQQVVFFPSAASVSGDGRWLLTIQGRIFEPAENSGAREALIDAIAPVIGVPPDDVEKSKLFRERAGYFLSDSERNRTVTVAIAGETVALPASNPAGFFTTDVLLGNEKVEQFARAGIVTFESLPTGTNAERFPGRVALVPEEGVTVVSDMDDTIKVTNIRDHKEKVANTFLKEFEAVPDMPELYRSWQAAFGPRIHFHIVSAGPWQLNEPLRQFTEKEQFPPFTWTMRSVDIGDPRVLVNELTANPEDFKIEAIRAIMNRFPKRRFLLVGDSGEKDPEAYAAIVREFMDRVDAVYIRNVTGEGRDAKRYTALFPGQAAAKLCVFKDPTELPPLTPASIGVAWCKPPAALA